MKRLVPLLFLLIASSVHAQTNWVASGCPTLPPFDGALCWNTTLHLLQYGSGGVWVNQAGGSGGGTPGGVSGNVQINSSGTFGAYGGTSCTNQYPRSLNANGVATCSTVTTTDTDTTIAKTGTDINTSNQVTASHFASALPAVQGGTGIASPTAFSLLYGNGASPLGTLLLADDQVVLGHTGGAPTAAGGSLICGDSTHALAYSHAAGFFCQAITVTAAAAGSTGAIQYNNAGALGGVVVSGLVLGNGSSAPSAYTGNTLAANTYANAISGAGVISGSIPVNSPNAAGNPAVYTGSTAQVSGIANVIHAGSGTLAAAFALCPAANAYCTVIADPGKTYTVSAPLLVGQSSTQPQTLIVEGAQINCTSTNNDVCIEIGDKGRIEGRSYNSAAGNTGSVIQAGSSAVLQAVVSSVSGPTGNAQTHFDLEDLNVSGNTSATINKAVLWISGCDGFCYVENVVVGGTPAASTGVLVDDSPNSVSGLTNVVNINGLWVAMNSAAAYGLRITSGKNGTTNVTCNTCSVVDATGAGTTAMVSVDTTGSTTTAGVFLPNMYIESATGQVGDDLLINNARNVNAPGLIIDHNGSPAITNCVHIQNSNTESVKVDGRVIGTVCTNLVKNDVSGYTDTANGAFDYTYFHSNGMGPVIDSGSGVDNTAFGFITYYSAAGTAIPTCNSLMARQETCVSDATMCVDGATYTSGGTKQCRVQCNAAGSTWTETGVTSCF